MKCPLYEDDPIESMFVRLAADRNPERMDLGIGVYRDDSGQVPVFRAVRDAELRIVRREESKSYINPLGNIDYCRAMERLVLGPEQPAPGKHSVISAQTPGAGSALRLGAELARALSPESRVWVSDPVWPHQLEFFEQAGMQVMTYRYYDQFASVLQFDEMLEDLKACAATTCSCCTDAATTRPDRISIRTNGRRCPNWLRRRAPYRLSMWPTRGSAGASTRMLRASG